MPSINLKDVTRAITSYIPTGNLPLPDELSEILQAYLDKHVPLDDADSQKLNEELIAIYQKDVQGQRKRYAPFLALLRQLRPAIARHKQLLQWWDLLVVPILVLLSEEKGLAAQSKAILVEILAPDAEEGDADDAARTSVVLSRRLLEMWLEQSDKEQDTTTRFLQQHIHGALMEFGRKRPKEFLMALDPFLIKKDYRCRMLSLLTDFIRQEPPHLHLTLETTLFQNLLRCLQIDTSTTVVSLALTALTMLLPHAPNGTGKHLPALFNIYARLLFWDRERGSPIANDQESTQVPDDETSSEPDQQWEQLSSLSESEDMHVPQLLSFFTFLYGLYPLNFMSYIRKPSRYLRHTAPDADDLDVQSTEVRQRSEQFRRLHLLHPNFYSMTIETELSDRNRWQRSMAADVTAICMAFYHPSAESADKTSITLGGLQSMSNRHHEDDIDEVSDQSILTQNEEEDDANANWRYTTSTIVVSADEGSQTFDGSRKSSMARVDSPTLPDQADPSSLGDVEPAEKEPNSTVLVDTKNVNIDVLQREIMLLKNELTFERYLKQQHLVHIGQLRRRHVREATIESETQNLLNANRTLKSKLEEAKSTTSQTKKEAEKSRSHAKKWEAELVNKLRAVKEEQKKLIATNETLRKDLVSAQVDFNHMKQLIVDSEARELRSNQTVQSMESNQADFDRLRKEVDKLNTALHGYEAHEQENDIAKKDEAMAISRLADLELKIASVVNKSERANQANMQEIEDLKFQLRSAKQDTHEELSAKFQVVMESTIAAGRSRLADAQQAHAILQKKYARLELHYLSLRDLERQARDEPLLSPTMSRSWSRQEFVPAQPTHRRNRSLSTVEPVSVPPSGAESWNRPGQQRRVQTEARPSTDGALRSSDDQPIRAKTAAVPQAQAELRVYGRGGYGNIKSKKKEDGKEGGGKKEKKGSGLGGLRGFVS